MPGPLKLSRTITPVAVGVLLAIAPASGQDTKRESLRGLEAVRVVVATLGADARRAGLNEASLRTFFEARFRQARIRVLTLEESDPSLRVAYLGFGLRAMPITVPGNEQLGWTVHVRLEVHRWACVVAAPEICNSMPTWVEDALMNLGVSTNASGRVRELLSEWMDELINDWLAVNP